MSEPVEITQLLADWGRGDRSALDELMPHIYGELHRLARQYMTRERSGHTLQPTALVNEAFLRLAGQRVEWRNRGHFFAITAQMMRRTLISMARARNARRRGDGSNHLSLDADQLMISDQRAAELIRLDDALTALTTLDPRKGRVVELRFFGGLSVEETAEVLQVSPETVIRDWKRAQAWLCSELGGMTPRAQRAGSSS